MWKMNNHIYHLPSNLGNVCRKVDYTYGGKVIKEEITDSETACEELCSKTPDCILYNWNTDDVGIDQRKECLLRDDKMIGTKGQLPDVISGNVSFGKHLNNTFTLVISFELLNRRIKIIKMILCLIIFYFIHCFRFPPGYNGLPS